MLTCPTNYSCRFLMVLMRDLCTFASCSTHSLDFLSIPEIFSILLMNHISAASILFSISFVNVQHSHPYTITYHTKSCVFKTLNLVFIEILLFFNIGLNFWKASLAMATLFFISVMHHIEMEDTCTYRFLMN